MAAPHVAGIAALLIGTKRLGADAGPRAIEQHIEATSRDLRRDGLRQPLRLRPGGRGRSAALNAHG